MNLDGKRIRSFHYSLTNLAFSPIINVKSAVSVSLLPNLETVDIFSHHILVVTDLSQHHDCHSFKRTVTTGSITITRSHATGICCTSTGTNMAGQRVANVPRSHSATW